MFLKEVSSAHQGCNYLIKNTTTKKQLYCEILLQFKTVIFYVNIVKCNLFLWSNLNLQHHYSSLQCHMIPQKFDAQETFMIIIHVENSFLHFYFRILWWL